MMDIQGGQPKSVSEDFLIIKRQDPLVKTRFIKLKTI